MTESSSENKTLIEKQTQHEAVNRDIPTFHHGKVKRDLIIILRKCQ